MAKAGASSGPGAVTTLAAATAMSDQPSPTQPYHVTLDMEAPRRENWLRVITGGAPRCKAGRRCRLFDQWCPILSGRAELVVSRAGRGARPLGGTARPGSARGRG